MIPPIFAVTPKLVRVAITYYLVCDPSPAAVLPVAFSEASVQPVLGFWN